MFLISRLTCLAFNQYLLCSEMMEKIRPEEWEQVTLYTEFKLNDLKQVDTLNFQSPSSSHKNTNDNGQKFQFMAEESNALCIKNAINDQHSTKGVLFLHDNALAHRALATQNKLAYLGFQCLDHPPYSPDLAP